MKRPKPELYNNRVIYLAARALSLPFLGAGALYERATAALERLKSPQRRRAEDERRQARARRSLRGLAGDHVQESSKAP
jgi:hypothetical protein